MPDPLRILFLSPRQCWPPRSGAKLRELYLAKALGEHASLTHVSFSPPGTTPPTAAELPFAHKLVSVPQPRAYTPARILRGLVSRWPLPVINYTSGEMKARLADLVRESRYDLIHLDSIHMSAYAADLRHATGAPVVYDWHNIESEAMLRYSRHTPSALRARYASLTARRLIALEQHILSDSFGHLVCSDRELAELRRRAPNARVAVIENGVDASYFAETRPAANRRRIVFVGSMDYHANAEAAVYFAQTIWPAIRKPFPNWTLTIVGANPTPAVQALKSDSIEVTGTVPDVRPYYGEAFAAIVPLRVGGGTRLKILEAMAAGVPVVSTTLGAEGLAIAPGHDILIADTPEAWLDQFQTLAAHPNLYDSLVAAGRDLVRSRYDWPILGNALYETYRTWLGRSTC